jgi:hypothetical protein
MLVREHARLLERRRVPVSAPRHLLGKRGVASRDGARLDAVVRNVSVDPAAEPQRCCDHVKLDVLSKKMFAAHDARVDHPHSHTVAPFP